MLIQLLAGAAGVPVYFIAKAACHVANLGRARRRLDADIVSLMQEHLPELDYHRVRCVYGASLPANWFKSLGGAKRLTADGMTFGNTIFLRRSVEHGLRAPLPAGSASVIDRATLALLLHELVHVDQVRRFGGEIAFAYRYALGFLSARGYRTNPLETEAYDLVARCAASLPKQLPDTN